MEQKTKRSQEYKAGDLVLVPGVNKVGMSLLYPAMLLGRYVSDDGVTQPHLWRIMYIGENLPREGERFASTYPWERM